MSQTLTFLLLGILGLGLIPVLVYVISKFAAVGWRRGNQTYEDWLQYKEHQEREKDDGEESQRKGP
jgi:hypothetical protein